MTVTFLTIDNGASKSQMQLDIVVRTCNSGTQKPEPGSRRTEDSSRLDWTPERNTASERETERNQWIVVGSVGLQHHFGS